MRNILVAAVVLLTYCGPAWSQAQQVSVAALPPVVVKTVPQSGDTKVDPALTKIQVTFSKKMMDKSWSPVGETKSWMTGQPRYLADRKTWVMGVKLEPGKTYAVWLNSERFGNFKDAKGLSAMPYLLVFETRKKSGAAVNKKTAVDEEAATDAKAALDEKTALAAFDEVWNAFDREYAMFAIKPQVDWAGLRGTYRPRAAAAKTNHELATVLVEMLDHLEDLHVYVQVDGQHVPGYNRPRALNANPRTLASLIGPITSTGHDLYWGRTSDGIGYVNIRQLSDDALPQTFDEVLGRMADTKGLILDLRANGGGSEPLGCQIAGRLLDRRRVYSLSQFRTGPQHTDLGPKHERACGPAGPWHYVGPVVVLQGQKTMSSAESFALALAQCPQVTTLGDRTAGSSGNPRRVEAGAGIVVNLPRWIDMDPQGKPIDAVGIAPKVQIDAKPEDFSGEGDPVLSAALENLRSRAKAESSPSGGVLQRR